MDMQEGVLNFQSGFNGVYPFTTDGVVIGVPNAGFEEEMQTKITFANEFIDLDTLHHENMHQWWGDNVSEANYNLTFFKEGLATLGEYLFAAAQRTGRGGWIERGVRAEPRRHVQHGTTPGATCSGRARRPTRVRYTLFSGSKTYTRPGTRTSPCAGSSAGELQRGAAADPGDVPAGQHHRAAARSGVRVVPPEGVRALPAELGRFFTQWWDTVYPPGGGANRPQITGPGLDGGGFHC